MIRSGSAIAALVLGVLVPFGGFFFPPIPILALVFGLAAMREIDAGYREGRGMAKTGIFFGTVAVAFYVMAAVIQGGYLLTAMNNSR